MNVIINKIIIIIINFNIYNIYYNIIPLNKKHIRNKH